VALFAGLLIAVGLAVAVVAARRQRGSAAFGMVAGGLAVACAGLIGLISFTDWNPPDWLRVTTGVAGALAWAAALGAGAGDLAQRRRRSGGLALLLAALAAAAVIGMASAAG
jgi:hypothetical protein